MAAAKVKSKSRKNRKTKIKYFMGGDMILAICVLILVVFGLIMVFSASYYTAISETGSPYTFLIKELQWLVLGVVAMVLAANINYHAYGKISWGLLAVSILLLILVVYTPLGTEINYAKRWIKIQGLTIMPGEIAKPVAIIFVSQFFSQNPARIKSLKDGILPMVLLSGVFAFLIIEQPNLSTAINLVVIIWGIMFVAGLNPAYVVALIGLGGASIAALLYTHPDSHWYRRITSFVDPFAYPQGEGWQVVQSLLALGSGGLLGLGLGDSIQKNIYLPEPQNDFIFAIIGEELGFIGGLFLIGIYMVLIWRIMTIAMNAVDLFGTLVASGIGIMIGSQVVLNIAVVTSSVPPTGIALPFISYGGNSLLICLGCMGVLMNINKHRLVREAMEEMEEQGI